MLFRDMIGVYCENNIKCVNILCWQSSRILVLNEPVRIVTLFRHFVRKISIRVAPFCLQRWKYISSEKQLTQSGTYIFLLNCKELNTVFNLFTTCFKIKRTIFIMPTQCIYMSGVILTRQNDYFPQNYETAGLRNEDAVFLLC
jgi:hypothetical protein